MIAEMVNRIGSIITNKIDPKYPYGFNVNPLEYKGADMKFFPGIGIGECVEPMEQDNKFSNDMPQHYRVGDHIDQDDAEEEDFWMLNILPAIIEDAFGYEETSPSARYPHETDEAYEERMLFMMDVTREDMDDLEAKLNLFLAEMN